MKVSRASKTIALSTSSSNIRVISQSRVKLSKLHLYNVLLSFCVSGCNSSESHNEQHVGVVNASVTALSE